MGGTKNGSEREREQIRRWDGKVERERREEREREREREVERLGRGSLCHFLQTS